MKYLFKLSEIPFTDTSHGTTKKRVLLQGDELPNALTQIAHGEFQIGESCPMHHHPTMDEYFYFIRGRGTYVIGGDRFGVEPSTLVEIPAGTTHQLLADKNDVLEFVYWGVSRIC